ncbi:HBL/NHE enterotoxin family protein [uncultured Psychroserpens sp.]|uniref:HBL/NHE enterotoxin family protein n=1 Tax=uncultured Psychroserpens sp. TaxID=255436 RepID=UPI0026376708|nr:HBL/NHE enterotoxin family protein [uncultured Psychroserpens sp.]
MLAPNIKLTTQLLKSFFSSLISVRFASISISHSRFLPISPTPDYIKNLEDAFNKSKILSSNWSNEKEPSIISQIPEMFIEYSNRFQDVCETLTGDFSKEEAIEALKWLKSHLVSYDKNTSTLQSNISQFSTEFKSYIKIIDESIDKANQQITGDRADVLDLQNQISVLYQDIAEETEKVSGSMSNMATGGAELAYTMLEYGFLVATSSAEVPVVGIIIAVGGLTYDAIEVAINEQRIAENLKRIKTLAVKVNKEDQQIVLLTNMNTMLNNLDKTLIAIHDSVDLGPIWTEESDKLDVAIQELEIYTGTDFKSLLPIQTISKAANAWSEIAKTATNIQISATTIKSGEPIKLDNN